MARRKRRRTYRRRAKRYVRRRGGLSSLKTLMKPMTAGIVTGVAQSYIPNDALGGYADSAVPIAVGYLMKDKALQTIGAYQLGVKIANNLGAPSGSLGGGTY